MDRQDYEELMSLHYVYHAYEDAAYTPDRAYRIMRETIGEKEKFEIQTFLPNKEGWTMPEPDKRVWGIVRHAGYYYLQTGKFKCMDDALAAIQEIRKQG